MHCEENLTEKDMAMPNWTSNRIYVEGEPADIRAFLDAVKWKTYCSTSTA